MKGIRRTRGVNRLLLIVGPVLFVLNVFDAGYYTAKHRWDTVVLAALAAVALLIAVANAALDGQR
jgi:hypothetical protein